MGTIRSCGRWAWPTWGWSRTVGVDGRRKGRGRRWRARVLLLVCCGWIIAGAIAAVAVAATTAAVVVVAVAAAATAIAGSSGSSSAAARALRSEGRRRFGPVAIHRISGYRMADSVSHLRATAWCAHRSRRALWRRDRRWYGRHRWGRRRDGRSVPAPVQQTKALKKRL